MKYSERETIFITPKNVPRMPRDKKLLRTRTVPVRISKEPQILTWSVHRTSAMGWLEIAFSNLSNRIRKTNSRKKLVAKKMNIRKTHEFPIYTFLRITIATSSKTVWNYSRWGNFKMYSYLRPLSNITLSVNLSLPLANPSGK